MIISLIGYRGTGKSTVGRLLAEKISLPFFDSDQVITDDQNRSIAAIFSDEGEGFFRQLECDTVLRLMSLQDAVIAWGGGVVLNETNRDAIRRSSHTVWLQASALTISNRIHEDQTSGEMRPPLTNLNPLEEVKKNLDSRESLYRDCSNLIVDTDCLPSEEIVEYIVKAIDRED